VSDHSPRPGRPPTAADGQHPAAGAPLPADSGPHADALPIVPLRHYGQWVAAAVVILLLARFVWQVATESQVRWDVVGSRLFAGAILQGLWITVVLTVVSMVLGIIGGVLLAVMRISRNPVLVAIASAFVWLFRGTPILVQILIWFNLALFLPTIDLVFVRIDTTQAITPMLAAVLGLALNESAYMSEIVRGGIISVDAGQREAAEALGMTEGRILRRVVLPQALRSIVPPMGNELVTLLKETSLVSVIGAGDLLTKAQAIGSVDFTRMEMFLVASIWYLVLTTFTTLMQAILERRLGRSVSGVSPGESAGGGGWLGRLLRGWLPTTRTSTPEAPATATSAASPTITREQR